MRIPYFVVFNRYTNELQAFGLIMTRNQPFPIEAQGIWLEDAGLGLGLWQGEH